MHKNFKIDLKSVSEEGTFEGFASVYGNTDLADEIVEKGAFKRTLDHSKSVTLLWQHDTKQPIGIGEIEDTDKGLKIIGRLNLDTQKGKEAYSLLKQRAIKGLSIGYDVLQDKWEKGLRYLKEVKLWEVSVVTFPCNEAAGVNSIKSAVPYQNLPVADKSIAWSSSKAKKNIKDWATTDGEIDFDKYKKAFVWHDPKNTGVQEGYKLPIADVIDGTLTVIPRAVYAAAAAVGGARGGLDVPDEDIEGIKSHINKYYGKLKEDAPWNKSFEDSIQVKDFVSELQVRQIDEMRWKLDDAFRTSVRKTIEDPQLNSADKVAIVSTIFDQYKTAYLSWLSQVLPEEEPINVLELIGEDTKVEETKSALAAINKSFEDISNFLGQKGHSDSGSSHSNDSEIEELNLDDILAQMKSFKGKPNGQSKKINVLEGIKID